MSHLFVGAVCAENLSAVPAMVFPVGYCETRIAPEAVVHIGVVGPFATTLPGKLNL
jgi:hypothetical protein